MLWISISLCACGVEARDLPKGAEACPESGMFDAWPTSKHLVMQIAILQELIQHVRIYLNCYACPPVVLKTPLTGFFQVHAVDYTLLDGQRYILIFSIEGLSTTYPEEVGLWSTLD